MDFTPPTSPSPSSSPLAAEDAFEVDVNSAEKLGPEFVPEEGDITKLTKFSALSGMKSVKLALFVSILLPLSSRPFPLPRVLLHGPPGTGKSTLCRCVAGELGVSLTYLESQEILTKYLGAGLTYLKKAFTDFRSSGGIMVIEECDVYTERRGRDGGGVAEMIMTEMEGPPPSSAAAVMLTSNFPQVITPAIMRRLTASIHVPGLDTVGRRGIVSKYSVSTSEVLDAVVEKTDGWGGADIHTLMKRAHELAVSSLLTCTDIGAKDDWTVPALLKEQVKAVVVGAEVWVVMRDMLGEAREDEFLPPSPAREFASPPTSPALVGSQSTTPFSPLSTIGEE